MLKYFSIRYTDPRSFKKSKVIQKSSHNQKTNGESREYQQLNGNIY